MKSTCLAALVVSSRVGFGQMVDLWAKLELDVVKVTEAGLAKPELDVVEAAGLDFKDCFIIGANEKDDVV